jgi:hypothetical protein
MPVENQRDPLESLADHLEANHANQMLTSKYNCANNRNNRALVMSKNHCSGLHSNKTVRDRD